MYDIHPEYFHWDENMDMASLERHIMYMCGFKLNYVTPSEVIQQLYWNSKLALDPSFSASVLDNTLINVANLASYFCLQNYELNMNNDLFVIGVACLLAVFPDNHEQRKKIVELLP